MFLTRPLKVDNFFFLFFVFCFLQRMFLTRSFYLSSVTEHAQLKLNYCFCSYYCYCCFCYYHADCKLLIAFETWCFGSRIRIPYRMLSLSFIISKYFIIYYGFVLGFEYKPCIYILFLLRLLLGTGLAQRHRTGLRAEWSGVRVPPGAGNFSLYHRFRNSSRAHPAYYPIGTKGSFPGGKAVGAWSWQLTSI
jgi:hypothetical protein